MGETKNFGPLEIKVLKCEKIISNNIKSSVAYLQVKDSSNNQNEKFLFLMVGHFPLIQPLLLLIMQFTTYNL